MFYIRISRRPAPLDVWYVVSIVDKPQWLPMGHNKSNDVMTDIMNFVKPLRYPIIVSTITKILYLCYQFFVCMHQGSCFKGVCANTF